MIKLCLTQSNIAAGIRLGYGPDLTLDVQRLPEATFRKTIADTVKAIHLPGIESDKFVALERRPKWKLV